MANDNIWQEVDNFLEEHPELDMSFGLEYSSTVDWNADFTPRANHDNAREYGLWRGCHPTRDGAIRNALTIAKSNLTSTK